MRLKLTLVRPSGGSRDIVVSADAVATVGDVARALIERDPEPTPRGAAPAEATLSVQFPGEKSASVLASHVPITEARIASGAEVSVTSAGAAVSNKGPVLAVLRVVEGPDKGKEFQLRSAPSIIGRDSGADFVLSDPEASKRHARVEVTRTVDFVDLNSANGIIVDGGEVTRASLEHGQTALIGSTLLRADIVNPGPEEDEGASRQGPVAFNRSPRVEARYPGDTFDGPTVPKPSEPIPFPWLAFLAPVVLGVVMYFITERGIASLLFVALSPILMLGTFITQRGRVKRKRKDEVAAFEQQIARLAETMERETELERRVRLDEAVGTAEVISQANALGPVLWTKRPEHWSFLNVRLGIGVAPSRNTITGKHSADGVPEFAQRVDDIVTKYEFISGVPIVDNLVGAGALGIAGDPSLAAPATHSVLAQLTGLHSPLELSITAITGPAWVQEFEWLKWLPHTGAPNAPVEGIQLAGNAATGTALLAQLEELIQSRTNEKQQRLDQMRGPIALNEAVMTKGAEVGDAEKGADDLPPTPCVVVLISDDAPVDRARLVSMIERAAGVGILPIWLAEAPTDLPAACRTFLTFPAGGELGSVGFVRTGQLIEGVEVDLLARQEALSFARRLASVTDAGALVADESDIPRSVAFLDLLGPEMTESSDAVIDRWKQNASIHDRTPGAPLQSRKAGRLRALVGQSASEALHLDLRTQGPHALVGGTTGAGKSEFLQAWVLGMAAEYSPDRVSFLFVDYKGGAAFADCVNLPHTVGLVTDLSPHLVRRALTSLRAELRHREHLLNRKKAKDLIELEKRGDPESPPALVLVIDEFAALVSEIPEFVDGVVDVAQRGRSLGIHLIMATQRPAGVIKDNLRANTNLRVALRMADESDSTDVIGSPVAASFDPSVPGRGIAKTGPGRLAGFQTGYAGGWTANGPASPSIDVADLVVGAPRVWEAPAPEVESVKADLGPNDTARLVSTFTAAAKAAGIPAPRKPWLDELASVYDLSLLRQRTDEELVIGVTDDASTQSQYPVYFRPDLDGNLAFYGTGGTGKSTALRTIAAAAGITPKGGPVHVYGLDFGSGGLRMLESLPHVGAIIPGDDTERITRLLKSLRETIDERVERYAAARAGTIVEYRKLASKPDEPRILLLVDGMAIFRQEYEFVGAAAFTMFQQLLTDGRQVGVHAVVTADRPSSISASIASAVQRRVVLRLADESDYNMIDTPSDVLSLASPAGRGVLDQLETQVAVFGGTPNVAEQSAAIEALGDAIRARGVAAAPTVESLADEIALASIVGTVPGSLVIGVADDNLAPVGIAPFGSFMLVGPPSSGRSTGLQTLVASVVASNPKAVRYYLGGARSVVGAMAGWKKKAAGVDAVGELARDLLPIVSQPATEASRVTIVIESLSEFLSSSADADLVALVKAAKRNEHFVIGESETSTWSQSWPLLMEFKSARRGFVLQPDSMEGDLLFKTSFPRFKRSEFPRGRGMLVEGGKARRVQLALPS